MYGSGTFPRWERALLLGGSCVGGASLVVTITRVLGHSSCAQWQTVRDNKVAGCVTSNAAPSMLRSVVRCGVNFQWWQGLRGCSYVFASIQGHRNVP